MPRPKTFWGKIKWRPVTPAIGVPAIQASLWSETHPDQDCSKILLATPHAARYLGLSKIMLERFLIKHRQNAVKFHNSYYFPLTWIDSTIRLFLPNEPLIPAPRISLILNIPKRKYWQMWKNNQIPTFKFGRQSYLAYSNLRRIQLNIPCLNPPRLTSF